MDSDDYVPPYLSDDRIRASLMAAQANKSIQAVHDRDFRPSHLHQSPRFTLEFDGDGFSAAVARVTLVIEGLCFEGAEGWDETQCLMPERLRLSERSFGGPAVRPIVGNDRATSSLYDPVKNLEETLVTFLRRVEDWANKPKYFKEVTLPYIIRSLENSTSEASTARKIRKALRFVGPIDSAYVRSFESLSRSMEEPILELRTLGEFVASILREGDEVSPLGSGQGGPTAEPQLRDALPSKPSSHVAMLLNPVTEASVRHRPVNTETSSALPASSSYFNKILNPELASVASTSGRVKTESAASRCGGVPSGFEDLLEAARSGPSSKDNSPSPTNKPDRKSTMKPGYLGSPSYSPPSSPTLPLTASLKFFSPSPVKAATEPTPDLSSPMLLQPSSLHQYHTRRPPAPPPPAGTPHWKIVLNHRKSHPIPVLHVGPAELNILTKCLPLLHAAALRAEECTRVANERSVLAADTGAEYEKWNESCEELEESAGVEAPELKKEKKKRKKNRPVHGANARDDRFATTRHHNPRRSPTTYTYHDSEQDSRPAPRRSSSVDSERLTISRLPPPPPPPSSSPGGSSAGTEIVTHFEERIGGDVEMADAMDTTKGQEEQQEEL